MLFKILKNDAIKVLHSNVSKFGKPSSGHRTGKCQSSYQFPRRTVLKNVQTIRQSHSFPMLEGYAQNPSSKTSEYLNQELPDVQAGLRNGRRIRDQITSNCWTIEKAREFQKTFTSASLTMLKPLTVDHNKFWKNFKEMGISDHLTCLLRNVYAGQEATVRTRHGTRDWFKIGTGIHQGCRLSPCLFNLYAEYIMQNAGLHEAKVESKSLGEISITSDMQLTAP